MAKSPRANSGCGKAAKKSSKAVPDAVSGAPTQGSETGQEIRHLTLALLQRKGKGATFVKARLMQNGHLIDGKVLRRGSKIIHLLGDKDGACRPSSAAPVRPGVAVGVIRQWCAVPDAGRVALPYRVVKYVRYRQTSPASATSANGPGPPPIQGQSRPVQPRADAGRSQYLRQSRTASVFPASGRIRSAKCCKNSSMPAGLTAAMRSHHSSAGTRSLAGRKLRVPPTSWRKRPCCSCSSTEQLQQNGLHALHTFRPQTTDEIRRSVRGSIRPPQGARGTRCLTTSQTGARSMSSAASATRLWWKKGCAYLTSRCVSACPTSRQSVLTAADSGHRRAD